MADPFDHGPDTIGRAKDDLDSRFDDLRRDASASAKSAADAVSRHYGRPDGDDATVDEAAASLRRQATQAASEAKTAAASVAEQARQRLTEIVDQQKAVGAAKISGVAKAAHSAAKELDGNNPHIARVVRTAAEGVDRLAEDFRKRDIGDVLATLGGLGRSQPVAFFGGAVLAGFVLSRFFKSDVPVVADPSRFRDAERS